MNEWGIREQIKFNISFFLGIALTVFLFFAAVALLSYVPAYAPISLLYILLVVFYISTIRFLILWNRNKSKSKYVFLGVSLLCACAAAVSMWYDGYVYSISAVDETPVFIWEYQPFTGRNTLAKLDKEANYTITDNAPVLDGATAFYPVYAAFVNAVYPENKYDPEDSSVLCSKTAGAYKNLLEGKADIIFCLGPSEEQLKQFAGKGIKITLVPIGREAFVFFVNKENTVNALNVEDIRNIYSGRIKNWKRLGGRNKSIKAYQRPENSGSQTALVNIMGNTPLMKPRKENTAWGMGDIIREVAAYRNFNNAIGYSFLHFSTGMANNNEIKLLSINNVYPSKETIQNGEYPFCYNFYAIYAEKNEINAHVKPFIEWIVSEQGQELVEKTGYVSAVSGKKGVD